MEDNDENDAIENEFLETEIDFERVSL